MIPPVDLHIVVELCSVWVLRVCRWWYGMCTAHLFKTILCTRLRFPIEFQSRPDSRRKGFRPLKMVIDLPLLGGCPCVRQIDELELWFLGLLCYFYFIFIF